MKTLQGIQMKKLIILVLFISFSAFGSAQPEESNTIRTRLCDYWRYNTGGNGYTCSFLGRYVSLVEADEVNRVIRAFESKINDLERRIQELEVGGE